MRAICSTLPLLVTLIGTNHPHHSTAFDDFAFVANFLDAGTNFHGFNASVMWPRPGS
jgi:hypothetical protein